MKVLVCGGRDYSDKKELHSVLSKIHDEHRITLVIHGDARGADTLAHHWALGVGIPVLPMPADWNKNGKAAGPIRNMEMLLQAPDLVVAFAGGRGTAHMVGISKRKGVKVLEVVS